LFSYPGQTPMVLSEDAKVVSGAHQAKYLSQDVTFRRPHIEGPVAQQRFSVPMRRKRGREPI
jgi:hypothetical protein